MSESSYPSTKSGQVHYTRVATARIAAIESPISRVRDACLIAHNKQITGVQKTRRAKPAKKKGKLPETV
jgi:hypothetical protein